MDPLPYAKMDNVKFWNLDGVDLNPLTRDLPDIKLGNPISGILSENNDVEYRFTGQSNVPLKFIFSKSTFSLLKFEIFDPMGDIALSTNLQNDAGYPNEIDFTPQIDGTYLAKFTAMHGVGKFEVVLKNAE